MDKIITRILLAANNSLEHLIESFKRQEIDTEQFLRMIELITLPTTEVILGGSEEMKKLRTTIILPELLENIVRRSDNLENPIEAERFIMYVNSI